MKHVITLAVALSAAYLSSGCGADAPEVEGGNTSQAIVGGSPAKAGMFPGIVSLRVGGQHWCGGTLIAPHWVLTAAHCVDPEFRGGYDEVVAGNLAISSKTGESLQVFRAYRHPKYVEASYSNDYALLRLKSDAKEPVVKLASTSETSALKAKTQLSVAGWGDTVENSKMGSDVLLYTTLPLIARKQCLKAAPNLGSETICAGAPAGGRDTCQGDSGGPLFAQIAGTQKQIAVVSSGTGCARPNTPGFYAGVAAASSWITATMAQGDKEATELGTCTASCDSATCTDKDPANCQSNSNTCLCACATDKGLCDAAKPTKPTTPSAIKPTKPSTPSATTPTKPTKPGATKPTTVTRPTASGATGSGIATDGDWSDDDGYDDEDDDDGYDGDWSDDDGYDDDDDDDDDDDGYDDEDDDDDGYDDTTVDDDDDDDD